MLGSVLKVVMPAKAGIPLSTHGLAAQSWTLAFAGVTVVWIDLEIGV
jgi:hypothetical protein